MNTDRVNVIRFVAYYENGFEMPISKLILGHGYMEQSGLSHETLLKKYLREVFNTGKDKLYAGYLYVENDRVKIFSGGSKTLNILENSTKSNKVLEDLEVLWKIKTAAVHLYPLLVTDDISHVMLSK
jgi:hypothetical protein